MSSPYSASGNNGISVADAKAYIASIDPDAIQDQITHYTNVATSLSTLAAAVTKINGNLQATWSGTAATAANAQFNKVIQQATILATALSESVVPTLQAAHAGAQSAQSKIKGVQDEVTSVPTATNFAASANTGLTLGTTSLYPAVASQASMPPDKPSSTMTLFEAENFNTQQRTAAAAAMNAVATPYTSSTSSFSSVAAGLADDANNAPAVGPPVAYTITPGSGGGSNGAANGYRPGFSTGGGTGGGGTGKTSGTTTLQSVVPPPPPPPFSVPPSPPGSAPPASPPVLLPPTGISPPPPPSGGSGAGSGGDPVNPTSPAPGSPGSGDPVGTDPVTGLPAGGGEPEAGGSDPAAPGVFGEGGLPGAGGAGGGVGGEGAGGTGFGEGSLAAGTGSGVVPGSTGFGAPSSGVTENGVVGGAPSEVGTGTGAGTGTGQGAEQSPVGMMGGMHGGGGGAGGGGGESSGPSAAYLRGRYLGGGDSPSYAPATWESPAIGGSEGVLIGAQPAEAAGVTSVYADAQDGQGKPSGMMGGGGPGGGGRGYGEEREEAGPRPDYLKEDPQWWTPEGSYVPPVVE